jgi:hypothetical protein
MHISLTQLRANLYQWIDELIATGEPIEIERKGTRIKITVVGNMATPKKKTFIKRPNICVGNPEELIHMDWMKEWFEKNAAP